MLAYFAKVKPGSRTAREIPEFSRILSAGPWQVMEWPHPVLGMGALATRVGEALSLNGTWRSCSDGLEYMAPDVLPKIGETARANVRNGIDITLACGEVVTIPLAAAAPRKISLSGRTMGDPITDYAIKAAALHARLASANAQVDIMDPDVLTLVGLAIMSAYAVTVEMIDDMGIVSTEDIDPIICAVIGSSPKASAAEASSSPSPAAA